MIVQGSLGKYFGMAVVAILSLALCKPALAQTPSAEPAKGVFTLKQAVDFALKNYPTVRASLERVHAAEAGVGLAQTNYLPRADVLWQANRATDNNVTGLLLPQSIIAPISGPVTMSLSNQSAWGSAAGLLFSWEPLDFGYRGAKVDAARAAQIRVAAEASLTRLDVSIATVNAYMTLLAAEQTVRAAEADMQRRQEFAKSVHVLVDNQLRPGADASRADADLARARVSLARAQQQESISRALLADILGIADSQVEVQESGLLGGVPASSPAATSVAANPAAQVQQARVEESQSQVHILDRSYYPKFYLQSSVYGRGSGLDPAGKFLGGSEGLAPDRCNWAVGLTVTFPVFDIFTIRSKKAVDAANERAEKARYDQTLQDLTGQLRKAQASLEGARKAYPGQTFTGKVARIAHSVDVKTRTMPVELDVNNADGRLGSGMFPEVMWAVRRTGTSLFVPLAAVVRTTEAIFVVRIRDGNTEWVNVQTGELDGKSIEVIGGLREGDEIAARGTDELRPGTHVVTKQIPAETQTRK